MTTNFSTNFCLPIRCSTPGQVLEQIEKNLALYQYFEVWLGAIEHLDDALLDHLIQLYGEKLIVLFRKRDLEVPLSSERQQFFIRALANSSALLDLDVLVQAKELKFLRKEKLAVKTILSYHNYELTPCDEELRQLSALMAESGATISKFSTFCRSEDDALRLLKLGLELRTAGREYIVLGMGEHGSITRTYGTLWGNKLIFAPLDKSQASAPGQLTKGELESIFEILQAADKRVR